MAGLGSRFFSSLTKGVDMGLVVMKSSVLSLLSCLFTFPYFYYLIFGMSPRKVSLTGYLNPWFLLFTQLFILLFICFTSALLGFSFEKRYDLKGFGEKDVFIRDIPKLMVIGLLMIAISYAFFDRLFYKISPGSYPIQLFYCISLPFKAAFTEEVILRLCLVTLGVGLFKNRKISIIIVSCMASLYSLKYYSFIGISVEINPMFVSSFCISFGANVILGYFFIKKGLLSCMFLKFVLNMKYMLIALITG